MAEEQGFKPRKKIQHFLLLGKINLTTAQK